MSAGSSMLLATDVEEQSTDPIGHVPSMVACSGLPKLSTLAMQTGAASKNVELGVVQHVPLASWSRPAVPDAVTAESRKFFGHEGQGEAVLAHGIVLHRPCAVLSNARQHFPCFKPTNDDGDE